MPDESLFRSGLLRIRELLGWPGRRRIASECIEPFCSRSPITSPEDNNRQGSHLPQLTWLGESALLLQAGQTRILVDPGVSRQAWWRGRVHAGGERNAWKNIEPIDLVVATHGTRSGMDPALLAALSRRTPVVAPAGHGATFCRRGFDQVIELAPGEQFASGSMEVTAFPVRQGPDRLTWRSEQTRRKGSSGFMISVEAGPGGDGSEPVRSCFWFLGTCGNGSLAGPCEDPQDLPHPDVVVIPVNGGKPGWLKGHQGMHPVEAVEAFLASGGNVFVPLPGGLAQEPARVEALAARLSGFWNARATEGKTLLFPLFREAIVLPVPNDRPERGPPAHPRST